MLKRFSRVLRLNFQNIFFLALITLFSLLILLTSLLACFFSYKQKEEEVLSQIDRTYAILTREYEAIIDNFWQIYMPLSENQAYYYEIWGQYFDSEFETPLSARYKMDLEASLRLMMQRNEDIQWIMLYNCGREDNYILYNGGSGMKLLPEDFPYLEELNTDPLGMQIYGMETLTNNNTKYKTFAISGGIPARIGDGKILAGYSLDTLNAPCTNMLHPLPSVNYVLTNNDDIIFDYSDRYTKDETYCAPEPYSKKTVNFNGENITISSKVVGRSSSMLSYYVSRDEFSAYCHQNTPFLLSVFLIFAVIAFLIYRVVLYFISKEVAVINTGLQIIGENDLTHQIPTDFHQSGLSEIAKSVNQMTLRLKTNIDKAYYYEMKQHEAELSDLQSKFNPHFLYNSLELLRSRCQLNGDETTADLITQLSAIFRGFINTKIFIPITEELTYSKRYLTLFGASHKDQVEIRYDFDKDILQYGIIRNVFQPLIENYFVHGFDTSNEDNYVIFRGKSLDAETMVLTMEDNGVGMTEEEIAGLSAKLHEPIMSSEESYGLKNLHQRIQLFYGKEYGLSICPTPNSPKGISVRMTVPKITCEEYEKKRKSAVPNM